MAEDLKTRRDVANALKQELQEGKEFLEEQGFFASKLTGILKDASVIVEDTLTKNKQGLQVDMDKAKTVLKTVRANRKIASSIMEQLGFLKTFRNLAKSINLILAANPLLLFAGAITALIVGFIKVQQIVGEVRKELGLSSAEALGLKVRFAALSFVATKLGLTSEDIKDSFDAIRQNFGGIDQASNGFILNLARAQLSIGATSQQIAKVLSLQESVSGASRETLLAQLEAEAATIRLAGVAPGAIFQDIAENAEFFASTMKDGGKNVMAAAVGARKLGLNLSAVNRISESLLSFEDSIAKQMEASVLLGRQINLDKARQLAFLDDQEGMMREVLKQVGGEAEFGRLVSVQRKALADAVGVEVEQLSRLVRQQEVGGQMEATKTALSSYETGQKEREEKTNSILTMIERNTKRFFQGLTN